MRKTPFNFSMLFASALSWLLVTLMPVINAHGNSAGVWATLCTVNGFELVQVEEGQPETHNGKPCPFSHFSTFHHDELPTTLLATRHSLIVSDSYAFLALSERFKKQAPRAPPSFLLSYHSMQYA
ncbi:hypothetical protein [Vibrio profundi]|uniref:hypothetical protein n=1 Tax=Vibrio profundi TaxID=1774960 RepID=UPI003734FB54